MLTIQFVYEHICLNYVWHMNIPKENLTWRELGVIQLEDPPIK